MNNTSYPWYLKWPAIIVAFFVFWPVAIFLIYLRTKNSKGDIFTATSNKKIYIILGAILMLMGITNLGSSTLVAIFMIVGGAAIIYYANTLAKKASRNRTYIDLIVNQGETSIDKMASMLNVKSDVVIKELQMMQTLGILKGANLNTQTHMISIDKAKNTVSEISGVVNSLTDTILNASSTDATNVTQKACPGCGAKYTGKAGQVITCDYCDAEIIF